MHLFLWLLFISADPESARSLLQQGLVALEQGKLSEARTDLEKAAKADPGNAYVWSSLAETYLRLGDRDQAFSAAGKADNLGHDNPVLAQALAIFYLNAGDAASGLRSAQIAAEKKPTPKTMDLLGRALVLNGRTQEGLVQLSNAWQQSQMNPQIAFDYADVLLHEEEFDRAAEVATETLKQHPNDAQLTLTLGVARYGQRRFDEAIVLFLQTIRLAPDVQQPYIFMGKMLDQAGTHLEEIKADYERWAAANPKSGTAQMLLAKALLTADPHDARGLDLLRKSVELDPNDWQAHYELGVLLEGKREYANAAKELEASSRLNPKEPMPHYHLARVYDRLGETERAKAERETHGRLTSTPSRR